MYYDHYIRRSFSTDLRKGIGAAPPTNDKVNRGSIR